MGEPVGIFHVPFRVDRRGEKKTFAQKASVESHITAMGAANIYLEPRGSVKDLFNGYLSDAPSGDYIIKGPGSLNTGVGKRLSEATVFTWIGILTVTREGIPRYVVS